VAGFVALARSTLLCAAGHAELAEGLLINIKDSCPAVSVQSGAGQAQRLHKYTGASVSGMRAVVGYLWTSSAVSGANLQVAERTRHNHHQCQQHARQRSHIASNQWQLLLKR
jgi:hypothetical protein